MIIITAYIASNVVMNHSYLLIMQTVLKKIRSAVTKNIFKGYVTLLFRSIFWLIILVLFQVNPSGGSKDQTYVVNHRCVRETFHNWPPVEQCNMCRKGLVAQQAQRRAFLPFLSLCSHLCAGFCFIIINS